MAPAADEVNDKRREKYAHEKEMAAATEEARLKNQRLRQKASRDRAKAKKAAEANSLITTVPLATVTSGEQEVAQRQNPDVNVNASCGFGKENGPFVCCCVLLLRRKNSFPFLQNARRLSREEEHSRSDWASTK